LASLLGKLDPRKAAFIVDRDSCAVFHRPTDVVNVDVLAEHGRRVHVVFFDRRSGESDEGRVQKAAAQILREP